MKRNGTRILIVCLISCLIGQQQAWAAPPGSGWRLQFADEFSGDTVDSLKWQTKYPWGRTHNHAAYMRDQNVVMGDGTASLIATRENFAGKSFTSGAISTGYNKYTFSGGYVEARILLPNTTGSWPAFWGLYTGWPPEADIMEYPIGAYTQSEYHTAFHYSTGGGGNAAGAGKVNPGSAGDLGDSYHVFGMDWKEDDYVRYYFDGVQVSSFGTDSAIAQMEYMYMILNYAVGGWPETPNQTQWPNGWQDQTKIDWVRVWQKPDLTGSTTYTYEASNSGWWGGESNWSSFEPQHSRQKAYFETLASQSNMEVKWNGMKTVGEVYIDGNTVYKIGDTDGDLDSLLLADDGDNWARLWVDGGVGGHTVNSRLEAWSALSVKNDGAAPLTLNGDILGHARNQLNSSRLYVRGTGEVILNGDGHYQRQTEVTDGATLTVNGQLYRSTVLEEALVHVDSGSTISFDNFDDGGGSLGNLKGASEYILLDNGTLELRGQTSTRRGLTVGAGGATLRAAEGADVVFRRAVGKELLKTAGADLQLAGAGRGNLQKRLTGTGNLTKSGSGQWILDASNNYGGNTSIQAGTLTVNGTSGTGITNISAGATLGGNGTILGQVTSAGSVAPGQLGESTTVTPETAGKLAFDFTGVQDNGPVTATSSLPAALTVVQGFDFGPGVQARHSSGGSNNGNEFNVSGWTQNLRLSNAIAEDDYLSFAVQPVGGVEMQLDTATFELWRNGPSAPLGYAVLTSLDGFSDGAQLGTLFASDPDDGSASDDTDLVGFDQRKTITGQYLGDQWTTDPVEVRLYGWGADNANGNTHITAAGLTANFRTVGGEISLNPTGRLTFNGDFDHVAGATIDIELGGTDNSDPFNQQYDSLDVLGATTLAGDLVVSLLDGFHPGPGDSFDILDLASVTGSFGAVSLPTLASGLDWDDSQLLVDGTISVVQVGDFADFSTDGFVDGLDLAIWEAGHGQSSGATYLTGDANGDGRVDAHDFFAWQRQYFPDPTPPDPGDGGGQLLKSVPEPSTFFLALLSVCLLWRCGR